LIVLIRCPGPAFGRK